MGVAEDRVYEERLERAARFSDMLAEQIIAMSGDITRLRRELRAQRQRAELWKKRALSRSKR